MEKLTKNYQDSAMKVLAGYDRGDAIVVMRARNTDKTTRGNPHYKESAGAANISFGREVEK